MTKKTNIIRKIPVGDFKIGLDERAAIIKVLDNGRLSEGITVQEFEMKFSKYIGTKYSIAVSSGTSALIAGLTALKYYEKLNIKENT